jgi:hypothetical protein
MAEQLEDSSLDGFAHNVFPTASLRVDVFPRHPDNPDE